MDNIWWALIPLGVLGIVAAIMGYLDQRARARRLAEGLPVEEEATPVISEGCCGMHSTCERDSLLAAVSPRIVYYDDEELDRYQGVNASGYSEEATEEFRDILITLDEDDVAGWVRSLQRRGIALPEELLPELFLIVGENRAHHMAHGPAPRH